MTEILTESFCERCGTRYTFQTPAPRKSGMKRLKVLSRGLKNYVLSDESTLEEAFADARSDEERSISSEQLDAFHQTFNFCMSCRQYTCGNCWNGPENLCLTCAPDLSREILPAAFPDMDPMAGIAPLELPQAGAAHANEDRAALAAASAWPDADLARDDETEPPEAVAATVDIEPEAAGSVVGEGLFAAAAGAALVGAAEPEAAEPRAATAEPITAEPVAAAPVAAAPEPLEEVAEPLEEVAEPPGASPEMPRERPAAAPAPGSDERAAAAAAQTAALLARFRPDRDLDQALAAYEERADAAEPALAAEPGAEAAVAAAAAEAVAASAGLAGPEAAEPELAAEPAMAMEAEYVVEVEPEVAAAAAPEAAAPEPAPPSTPVSPERRDDRVEIPTWVIVAPDTTSTQPAASPPAITPSTTPPTAAWPPLASAGPTDGSGPQWPTAPFLAAPASRARDAMWAASSAELVGKAGGGVQSCVSCGLPLSATARFCRRCGSRQG